MNANKLRWFQYRSCFSITVCLCVGVLPSISGQAQQERVHNFPTKRDYPKKIPKREHLWVFIMAGQSNMAGRGLVQPLDTVANDRILSINARNEIIVAKEPLHFYEPDLTGLDCGLSFANRLIQEVDEQISILILPAAVGGSSTRQWLGDSLHRNVRLMTNFRDRFNAVSKYGTLKGILWHQGESDTDDRSIPGYEERLKAIFADFRQYCNDPSLPILIGKLGSYSENPNRWNAINNAIESYAATDNHAYVIETADLKSKEDKIHFDSQGQRTMGKRMAEKFADLLRQ
jgi:hypothetical protein